MKSVFRYALASAVAALAALTGCEDPGDIPPQSMVVEGVIGSDGYLSVLLTMSATPGPTPVDVADIMVRHASVSVTDVTTGRRVMLTGGVDRRYFPPYRYYTSEIKGVPGHTYRICARYRGAEAVAESVMPPVPTVDSVTQERVAATDTLRALTLHLTAPPDCPAYYHVSTRVAGSDDCYLPGVLGTAEALVPGAPIAIPVMRAKTNTDREKKSLHMPVGRIAYIRLERVSREVYDFWYAFDNAALVGDSQFIGGRETLPGNVSGAYGVWSAAGIAYVSVAVGVVDDGSLAVD